MNDLEKARYISPMYTRLKDGKVSNPDWDGFRHLMKEKYPGAFNPHMCEVHLNEDPSSIKSWRKMCWFTGTSFEH